MPSVSQLSSSGAMGTSPELGFSCPDTQTTRDFSKHLWSTRWGHGHEQEPVELTPWRRETDAKLHKHIRGTICDSDQSWGGKRSPLSGQESGWKAWLRTAWGGREQATQAFGDEHPGQLGRKEGA